jgi:hypothetical protein
MSEQEALTFQTRDDFNRVGIADNLIKLLISPVDISPMVIDGDWGTGKTEFCQKLINKFTAEHENYQLVYVDAFQADHADDPLMTILAEVAALIPEGEKKEGFMQKAIPVARYGIKTALKAVVSHVLKQEADEIADGVEEHLQDAANKAIDASVAAVLKDHEKAKKNLIALQTTLAELANESPIVIFIDELDRCRPDFAVHMLEVIKHTFDVENVKFVLVTNTRQLRAAINHSYGSTVDAQRYLDKFLKFSIKLPTEVYGRSGYYEDELLASVEHFLKLMSSSTVLSDTDLNDPNKALFRYVSHLIQVNELSLREVETLARHLAIYHSLSQGLDSNRPYGYCLLRVFAVLVFCFRQDIYGDIQSGRTKAEVVAECFGVTALPEYDVSKFMREHALTLGVILGQSATYSSEMFTPEEDVFRECWRNDFSRYFDGMGAPSDLWKPIKDVFSVLSLSGQRR